MIFIPVGAASRPRKYIPDEKPETPEELEEIKRVDGIAQLVSLILVLPFGIWAMYRIVIFCW